MSDVTSSKRDGLTIARERIAKEAIEQTGSLNLGQLGLKTLPEELFQLPQLRRLCLEFSVFDEDGEEIHADEVIAPNELESELVRLNELPSLTSLKLTEMPIVSLESLAGLNGLVSLNCSDTKIQDLSPLAGLSALQDLDCSGTQVQDLSPLVGLSALQQLNCSGTQIQDLAPLAGLSSLQQLDCSMTQTRDLSPLAGLFALQRLICWETQIQDLSPLAGLSTLQQFDCCATQIQDLSPLAGLSALQQLDCSMTQIRDLSPLAGLSALQTLDCWHTQIQDLSPLVGLSTLQKLDCSLTQIQDLLPVAGLSTLQKLDCSQTQIQDLSPLAGLSALQDFDCSGTQVQDLSPLVGLSALQHLSCSETQIQNLSPLAGLSSLQQLDCSMTQTRDLSPLVSLPALQQLNCSETQIQDLSSLAGLSALHQLSCWKTQLQDLSPLAGLSALQHLNCSETQIQDLSPLANLCALQYLNCSNCVIVTVPQDFWDKPSLRDVVLYETQLANIPTEVLSQKPHDSCLESLCAHLLDNREGAENVSDVKLMVLGNGRAGKTQICRRLRNETYDETVSSTHGIVVTTATLPEPEGGELTRLHLWDFGGQEIYHGTHALFMRTRAVFLTAWTPETENATTHTHGGLTFRNHPLAYWLAYIRHLGGEDSPVLVVQTRCDRPEDDARRLPAPDEGLAGFRFCTPLLHYSALNNRGRASLDESLRDAVTWLREHRGMTTIGIGRMRVQRRLETLRDADAGFPPEQRRYRTLSQEHFRQLCDEERGVSSPEHLLDYFHNTGLVFYRQGLFNNCIILDQGWALEAVYAVFNREKSYVHLKHGQGRFNRTLLDLMVWDQYGKDEQELFLSLMESCGVCFKYRKADMSTNSEPEYIAPELLPDKSEIEKELEEKWDSASPKEEAVIEFELHHPGLLPGLVAKIGSAAGINGLYWRNGVCVWERNTQSHALIEQESRDDWRGVIRIQTQGGQAATLLERFKKIVTESGEHYGIRCREKNDPMLHSRAKAVSRVMKDATPEEPPKLDFAQPTTGREFCVSYAWGDHTTDGKEREQIVDRLCAAAEAREIRVLRDKNVLGLGERISKFMVRIGRADRVFVILSDKYLKSPFCMFELFEVWRNSRRDEGDFLQRVRVYTLPCARVFTLKERLEYAAFWKTEQRDVEALIKEHGTDILGESGFRKFKLMSDFAHHVGDILETLADIVQPRTFEELEQYGLNGDE